MGIRNKRKLCVTNSHWNREEILKHCKVLQGTLYNYYYFNNGEKNIKYDFNKKKKYGKNKKITRIFVFKIFQFFISFAAKAFFVWRCRSVCVRTFSLKKVDIMTHIFRLGKKASQHKDMKSVTYSVFCCCCYFLYFTLSHNLQQLSFNKKISAVFFEKKKWKIK